LHYHADNISQSHSKSSKQGSMRTGPLPANSQLVVLVYDMHITRSISYICSHVVIVLSAAQRMQRAATPAATP
jgi:hypothetical protein